MMGGMAGDTRPYVPEPSFDLDELVGRSADEAAQRLQAEGFFVQLVNLDRSGRVTADLGVNRVRVFTRGGLIESAHQG
jgi:hypothetical protein